MENKNSNEAVTGVAGDPDVARKTELAGGTGEGRRTYTTFAGQRLVVSGDLETMLRDTKVHLDRGGSDPVLIFEDETGKQVDFDFRGSIEDVLARIPSHPLFAPPASTRKSGPGRPRLGVVCREVSLQPHHWEWLEQQPGGISSTLRKLVEGAKRNPTDAERARRSREAVGRFLWSMAGNLPGFEEASRALFAGNYDLLEEHMGPWPADVRGHVRALLGR